MEYIRIINLLCRWLKNLNEGGMCLLTGAKPEAECVVKVGCVCVCVCVCVFVHLQ